MSFRGLLELTLLALFILSLALVVSGLHGCAAASRLPAYCTEEVLYTAAQLRCVDKAETRSESHICRSELARSCGLDGGDIR